MFEFSVGLFFSSLSGSLFEFVILLVFSFLSMLCLAAVKKKGTKQSLEF